MDRPAPLVETSHSLIEHPEGLLGREPCDGWMVLRCQPAAERRCMELLASRGVPHCGLWATSIRRYTRSRSRRSERGFLPGHWFACWPPGHHDLFDRLRPFPLSILPVPAGRGGEFLAELRAFCRVVLAGGALVEARPEPGTRVVVTTGTLAGCQGQVVSHDGAWHLHVALSLLGTAAVVSIDAGCVQRIDPR